MLSSFYRAVQGDRWQEREQRCQQQLADPFRPTFCNKRTSCSLIKQTIVGSGFKLLKDVLIWASLLFNQRTNFVLIKKNGVNLTNKKELREQTQNKRNSSCLMVYPVTSSCFRERIKTLLINLELKSHLMYELGFILGQPINRIESLSANLATQIDVSPNIGQILLQSKKESEPAH